MSSKLPEAEALGMELEEIHAADRSPAEQDQQGRDALSKRFGPEKDSRRYEFRASNKNQNQHNVSAKRRGESPLQEEPSAKRRVESPLPEEPSTKRRRTPMSTPRPRPTPTPTLDVSGINRTIPERSLRKRRQQIGSSSSLEPEVTFQEVSIGEADFFRLINRRIQVYWSMDDAWYTGLVKRYDPTNKLHHVVYDDDEEEWVSLERDKFKIQILVPGEFSTIPNSGIGRSNREDLGDRSIDNSQKKTSRRKVLREEQKGSINAVENSQKKTTSMDLLENEQKGGGDVPEKRNSKRVKRFHGIDDTGIESTRSAPDIYEKVKTPNEDRKRPVADVLNDPSSGADDGTTGASGAGLPQSKCSDVSVYMRRRRHKSSLNVDNSRSGGPDVCNRAGAQGGVINIGASSSCSDLGSPKVAGDAFVSNCHPDLPDLTYSVDNSSKRASTSGAGETCIGSRGNKHAAIGEMGGTRDMELEKVLMDAELPNCPEILKNKIYNAPGVEETCMGSRGDEHAAMAVSALLDCKDMELERVPMNAEFQNCPQNFNSDLDNASGMGKDCMGSRGDENAAIGASELADCSDTKLEKAPTSSEFQNCPENLNTSVSALPSRFDDSARNKAGQESFSETAISAANKESLTYFRKRTRKSRCTECNKFPVKRIRKLHLKESAVSSNGKGKEIIPAYHLELVPVSTPSSPERLNVSIALKVHMSPLYLREPSFWQCIAGGLQVCKMCPVNISRRDSTSNECEKILSWENLMVFLGFMFLFLNFAGSEPSRSLCHTQMELQQFEAGGLLNSRKYTDLPFGEWLQSMTMRSDVKVELLVFDTMSNAHKLCFWGPFSDVLSNFAMSLASLMSSEASRFPAEIFGPTRPLNLSAPIQSITVRLSSLQNGAWSPLICNFENLHNMASANWKECKRTLNWLVSSSKSLIQGESSKSNVGNIHSSSHHMDYRGNTLDRAGALCEYRQGGAICEYKQGAEVVNVFRSVENQHFTSSLFQRFNRQFASTVRVNQSKKPLGRIVQCHQPVPSIHMTSVDSPNFFQYLHLKLFGKAIYPDYCQSYESLPSEEAPNEPTRKRSPSIDIQELVSVDGDLETDKWSAAKLLTLEDNNPPVVNDTIAPSSALSSGFDINVTGTSSQMVPVFPIRKFIFPVLTFLRRSTEDTSWHFSGISVPSSHKGRTSILTTHVDSLQARHTESDLNKGHFVRENQREYNMLQSVAPYSGRMESSQSGCSHSISDNADDVMLKFERPGRRGRPFRREKKDKYKDADLDSQTCATNILFFGGGQNWREIDAEVALEALSLNEWVLSVKLDGMTRFRYKAQEEKIRRAQDQKYPKAGEQTFGNSNFHPIVWTGGKDWKLEFTERKQWSLFRKMYEECYSRNLRAASIKNIPIPTVREINVGNLGTDRMPFERPMSYIKTAQDEVSRALDVGRVVYDMDSEDEEWLSRFNSADADYDIMADEVSEETFEAIIDLLEKTAFMQECEFLTVDDAIQICSGLAPVEVLASIHGHWMGKRKKKCSALVREFQTPPSNRRKHGGKSSRGKTFRGQQSGKTFIGKPYVRNWDVGTSTEMQQQFYGITSGSEGSSDAVVLSSYEKIQEAERKEAERAERAAREIFASKREIAALKRRRAEILHQAADMAIYKAVVATRKAEAIRDLEQARLLRFQISEQFSNDSRIIENVNASGGSVSSLSVQ